jgi:hypothetical protein
VLTRLKFNAAAEPLSPKLLKKGTLEPTSVSRTACPTTQADTINADLLEFISSTGLRHLTRPNEP